MVDTATNEPLSWNQSWGKLGSFNLSEDAIQWCKVAGWDFAAQDPADGTTILHKTAGWIQPSRLQALIDAGAPVNKANNRGDTPIFSSIENNNFKNTRVLMINGALTNVHNDAGSWPLYLSLFVSDDHITELLLKDAITVKQGGEDRIVRIKKANTNRVDPEGNNLLQRVLFKVPEKFTSISPNRLKLLIDNQLDLNHRNKALDSLMNMITQHIDSVAAIPATEKLLEAQLLVIFPYKPSMKLENREGVSTMEIVAGSPKMFRICNHCAYILNRRQAQAMVNGG